MKVINPATGDLVKEYPEHTSNDVEKHLGRAAAAFGEWRTMPFDERAARLRRVAGLLRSRKQRYAELMTLEMGKPITEARAEIEKCAWVSEYFAEHAARFLAPESVETDARKSYVTFQPLGVVLAVMPWNFPFWQVFRCAAPSLMAGNAVVLKHAANVPGSALAIGELFSDAGCPDGTFTTLLLSTKGVARLVESPTIAAVALTGSMNAGRAVASLAGKHLKKTVLELGGSDAYVVLDDADLEATVRTCAASRLVNSGQSCIAAKRFIVVETIRSAFEEQLIEQMRSAVLGDPMMESTQVGPLARGDLRDELHRQVQQSVRSGARLALGGEIPKSKGFWYLPTVLTDVAPGMPAYEEELFGPVAAIISARDEDEAIRIANDSSFGLGAAVFTRDERRGESIAAEQLEAGVCFVNAHVRSDPRLPFGGVKSSGYGRELSAFGIREFVNIKTVWLS